MLAAPRRDAVSTATLTALTAAAFVLAADQRGTESHPACMSNKELAQTLFVTMKAVEIHLSSVYRKLQISSRAQLAQLLADTGNPAFSRLNLKATGQPLRP